MTAETALRHPGSATLDYYLLQAEADEVEATGLLVEEFVLADDLSAARLRSAGWTPADGGWWSSAAYARAVRTDPRLRARLAAVDRATAEATYRRLGGGNLPDEDELRDRFRDDVPLATGAPLRLSAGPDVHRILFAGELDDRRLARLGALLRLDDPDGARPGVVGTGRLRVNDTNVRWDLRRVGGGIAWCLDVTAEPAGGDGLPWVLRQLIGVARGHGLIPATIERLA
ncbi:hypothetical protein ONA91_11455 [Micromonospora sp. DR5-3]|uniref:hypothetical protein n=1 Tax=unclassified Micromonospora TaxID=2617518 RepID=UPI0011D54AD6|nr:MULTISPECIES: hypothetical protein [unclassified Micromonospora]MCW3815072.1 hypothetical protein [Micromonospora sp. DR5-3]TYC25384.1 hypothetical protein FXF52_06205 [Micromonospora sp. MP36]